MMAHGTARRSAELAVANHVAGDASDDGSLDTALRIRWRDRGEGQQAIRCELVVLRGPGWCYGSSRLDSSQFRPGANLY